MSSALEDTHHVETPYLTKITTRPRQQCPCVMRRTAGRTWRCSLGAPWPTCCMECRSRTTFPTSWPTQPALGRTETTAQLPSARHLPRPCPSSWPSSSKLASFADPGPIQLCQPSVLTPPPTGP
ncbi:hypothetical protein ANANG_G00242330 [Anguilla anguilla]|uniref:Uncharacterized protein n=1 Tax=Anguilla anguilla TaxID=7936 RepID=A0A9D3LQW1_ANGAN|nr:hypothetical protein ANANG_G00242330 [Anguilla anguilla]